VPDAERVELFSRHPQRVIERVTRVGFRLRSARDDADEFVRQRARDRERVLAAHRPDQKRAELLVQLAGATTEGGVNWHDHSSRVSRGQNARRTISHTTKIPAAMIRTGIID